MSRAPIEKNPKILHRIYFTNFAPFHDPFLHYLDSWREQMPGYTVMEWNASNLNVNENDWTKKANEQKAPVFLAEYFRWKLLYEYGGLYLDADCEIINGEILHKIIDELHGQDEYDCFFGVEERENGHPTAQTFGAKKGCELAKYMMTMYEKNLAPLWSWREKRGLIGPQLMSLYFLDKGANFADDGFFKNLDKPVVSNRAKIYPQTYFSPKFSLLGEVLHFEADKTCVYHLFANSNIDFAKNKKAEKTRTLALKFNEYRDAIYKHAQFPRYFDASHFSTQVGELTEGGVVSKGKNGVLLYGPYIALPPGDYTATVNVQARPRRGTATLSVTAEIGKTTLATIKASFNSRESSELSLPFNVKGAGAKNIEFCVAVENIDRLEIKGVNLEKKGATPQASPAKGNLKILHRVYFGFDGKPDMFARYLETWQEQLPDFQIMKWDATNLPMDINPYVRKLYLEKDHAFLTDFFRWYLLREYGGTYLDADVEVVNGAIFRQLIDELEAAKQFDAFIGIDERGGGWYTAHSMSSKPASELSKFMCDVYENFGSFAAWRKKGMYFWAPQLVALYFANKGHNVDGMGTSPKLDSPMVAARVKIYPQDWFSPLSPTGDKTAPFALNGYSENTNLCHHFACSWHDAGSAYLEHSKKRGGQANVLLQALLKASENRVYPASSATIQTQVGVKSKEIIATQGKAGFLAYGPYTSLTAGDYAVTYVLKNVRELSGATVDITANAGGRTLVSKKLSVGDVENGRVTLRFSAGSLLEQVEFRINVGVKSAFELSDIELRKL